MPKSFDSKYRNAAQFLPTSSTSATSHAVAVTPHQSHTEAIRRRSQSTRSFQIGKQRFFPLICFDLKNAISIEHMVILLSVRFPDSTRRGDVEAERQQSDSSSTSFYTF